MREGREKTAAPAEEVIVTDRSVENPWVVETIGWGGVMLDIGCLGSEDLGARAARGARAGGRGGGGRRWPGAGGAPSACSRVYSGSRFRRLLRGFRPLSIQYYRRDGN